MNAIGYDYLSQIKELQNQQWAREDTIRKETQAREDSAYQRAVKDMQKSGVNPNLVGINPANSGGGIQQSQSILNSFDNLINNLTEEKKVEVQKVLEEMSLALQSENFKLQDEKWQQEQWHNWISTISNAFGTIIDAFVPG